MMDNIIRATEGHKLYHSIVHATQPATEQTPPHAVAAAAADLAEAIEAPVIVAFTSSGTTAARIARKRPVAADFGDHAGHRDLAPPPPALGRAWLSLAGGAWPSRARL